MIKQPGLCSLCGTPCYEILVKYGEGYRLLQGRVRSVGKPLENCIKTTLVLLSGSRMDITLCKGCSLQAQERLPELWSNIVETNLWEIRDDIRVELGLQPLPEDRKKQETAAWCNERAVGIFYQQGASNG